MSEAGTRTRITEVGRVIVPVSDQDRAIDFYVGQLGFEKRADTPYGDGARWIELAPPGGSTAIAVVLPREGDPVPPMFWLRDQDGNSLLVVQRGG